MITLKSKSPLNVSGLIKIGHKIDEKQIKIFQIALDAFVGSIGCLLEMDNKALSSEFVVRYVATIAATSESLLRSVNLHALTGNDSTKNIIEDLLKSLQDKKDDS